MEPFAVHFTSDDLNEITVHDSIDDAFNRELNAVPPNYITDFNTLTGIIGNPTYLTPTLIDNFSVLPVTFGGDNNIKEMMQRNPLHSFLRGGYSCYVEIVRYMPMGDVLPLPARFSPYIALYKSGGFSGGIGLNKRIPSRITSQINFQIAADVKGFYEFTSEKFLFTPLNAVAMMQSPASTVLFYNSYYRVLKLIPHSEVFAWEQANAELKAAREKQNYFQQGSPENLKTNNVVL